MAPHSSILAWRIPWTEEPCGLQSVGLQRVGQDWATFASLHEWINIWSDHYITENMKSSIDDRRKMPPTWTPDIILEVLMRTHTLKFPKYIATQGFFFLSFSVWVNHVRCEQIHVPEGWGVLLCSVQFSSVAQSCPTLCDPMNHSTPGLPVYHQPLEFTQTHVHRVSDAIQPSQPLSSLSPPAPNPSQHQSLFQWVNSLHEVAKVLEFQL